MAKKKSKQQQVEIKLAEIRNEAAQGQPQMILLTAAGAGVALKGAELGAEGINKDIRSQGTPTTAIRHTR